MPSGNFYNVAHSIAVYGKGTCGQGQVRQGCPLPRYSHWRSLNTVVQRGTYEIGFSLERAGRRRWKNCCNKTALSSDSNPSRHLTV